MAVEMERKLAQSEAEFHQKMGTPEERHEAIHQQFMESALATCLMVAEEEHRSGPKSTKACEDEVRKEDLAYRNQNIIEMEIPGGKQ